MNRPAVSVVMAVYDGERFLAAAIRSVLDQTFTDFELLVIDDGSTDGSAAIVESFDDPRLRLLRNGRNLGHPASLNLGIRQARAPLIARIDADDIAEPRRFERQVAYLQRHPAIDVLGTWTTEIDEHDRTIGEFVFPPSEGLIRWAMTRTNVIYHPSVMMRRRAVADVGGYHEGFRAGDDHMLFNRMLMEGYRLAILPEKLLRYRRSAGQITQKLGETQQRDAMAARRWYVAWLLDEDISAQMLDQVSTLQVPMGEPPAGNLADALRVTRRIREACLVDCDELGRREINRRSRAALLYHARRLMDARREREARLAWREAWRCGRTITTDRRLWRLGAQLVLPRGEADRSAGADMSPAGTRSS